jgi:hypothetical protein
VTCHDVADVVLVVEYYGHRMRDPVVLSPSSLREPHITRVRKGFAIACCVSLAGCAGTTLFQSDFAKFPPHWPPIGDQKVGTTEVDPVSDQYRSH